MYDGDLALTLGHTRGDDLTSPPLPALLAPVEVEGGRIIVTDTGSSTAEGRALPRGQEVPPLVRREVLTLSEEKESLLEAPRWVFSYD